MHASDPSGQDSRNGAVNDGATLARLSALQEIAELQAEFTHRLDHEAGRGVAELFTPQGSYVIGGEALVGRRAIREAYRARESAGPRTARHLFVNGRVRLLDGDECRHAGVLVLYALDGEPVLPLPAPLSVSDVEDHLVRTDEGWRFERRELVAVFRGDGAVRSPQSSISHGKGMEQS